MKIRNRFLKYVLHSKAEGVDDAGGDAGDGGDAGAAGGGGGNAGDAGAAGGAAGGGGNSAAGTEADAGKGKVIWPENWRENFSRGDEKRLNVAKRYASPEAAFDALVAAQDRIRSGQVGSPFPKDGTPEQQAEWRKTNGVPDDPKGYDLKFDSGLVIGDEDKETIEGFLQVAHQKNMQPEVAKDVIEWYYKGLEEQKEKRSELDEQQKTAGIDELNIEWGKDYRANINRVGNMLSYFPETVREALQSARMPDGTAVFNHPDVLRGFVQMALEVDPASTLVPNGSGDPMKGVEEEMAEIEKVMRENRAKYDADEKMQARYRDLIDAKTKLSARMK